MKKNVQYCDSCGKETTLEPLKMNFGRESNGIEMVSDIKHVDLCGVCAMRVLNVFTEDKRAKEIWSYISACRDAVKRSGK